MCVCVSVCVCVCVSVCVGVCEPRPQLCPKLSPQLCPDHPLRLLLRGLLCMRTGLVASRRPTRPAVPPAVPQLCPQLCSQPCPQLCHQLCAQLCPPSCVCVCVCVCALRAALLNINLNLAKYNALHFVVYAFWGQFWCSKLGPRIGSFSSPSLGIISPIEVAPYAGALARYGLSGRGRLNKTFSRRARRSRGARSVVRVVSNSWY